MTRGTEKLFTRFKQMPVGIQIAIAFVIGGGLGLLIGWLVGSRRQTAAPADGRLENELREQAKQRESELE